MMGKMFSVVTPIFPFCILFMVLSYYVIYTFESSFCWMMGKKMPDTVISDIFVCYFLNNFGLFTFPQS